jgi:acetyltransferase
MAPYPAEWEHRFVLSDGAAVFVRPIRPEDEQLYERFMAVESIEDLRWRFFAPVKELDPALITRLTHIDYDRAMAFIALDEPTGDMLGVARLHQTVPNETGEYAVIVRSDLKSHGLGWHLMQTLIDYARKRGLRVIQGQVMHDNEPMLDMCAELGFEIATDPNEPSLCNVKLAL